ncbi:MAG TPA: aromatic ring-hydroxylating dioxygenase subunit alpha [Stellaceae bacterium]|nr:aromatic ring-hydroxylating dioxygenase subunit alpha [Stellaceae bacterium]
MYLKNCWYVAAWDREVGEAPFARTLCGVPVVLYRGKSGTVAALEDRCCHRNLPLSMGTIEGEDLRCGYHGLRYDASGQCVEVPGQRQIPPGARVKSFPVIKRWKMLWIWMGDPAKVDESLLPHWEVFDDPRNVNALGNDEKPLHMRCNWQLNNDNLLDLSHVFYVHKNTLGGGGADLPIRTERSQRGVRMSRWIGGTVPTPLFAQYLGMKGGTVDRWQVSDLETPTHCLVDAGFAPTDAGLAPDDLDGRSRYPRLRAFITATPETPSTSFMFYLQARNFAKENVDFNNRVVADFRRVFHEDIAVMEAQQRVNDAMPDAPTVDVNVDAPPLAMRRLLNDLLAAEAGA